MRRKAFESGLSILVTQFPEKVFNGEILWEFLRDLTDEQYLNAIKEIIASFEEVNKATNIIAVIRSKALCNKQKTAGEAWAEVLHLVRTIGSYSQPTKFSSEAVRKSIEAIGWRQICLSETPMVERAHFLKIYETIAAREKNTILSESVKLLITETTKKIGVI